jgi:anti-sigma B factor antagonist
MTSPAEGVPFDERLLRVVRADRGDCTVLVVQGDLDLAARGRLLEAAWGPSYGRRGRPLVLDLSGVGFMASVGAAELVMLRDECAPLGVEVRVVVGRSRSVRLLLALTGLNEVFAIFCSVDDAVTGGRPREA